MMMHNVNKYFAVNKSIQVYDTTFCSKPTLLYTHNYIRERGHQCQAYQAAMIANLGPHDIRVSG